MFIETENARYMVYLNRTKYWLRIRQLKSGIYINMDADDFLALLYRGVIQITLNKKRTNTKSVTFNSFSGDFHSEGNYIDTVTTRIGGKLASLISLARKDISSMTREELREEERIRRQYQCPYGYKLAFPDEL